MKGFRGVTLGFVTAACLASTAASAHTTEICWRNEPDGSTTFFAGNYHGHQQPAGGIAIDGATYPFTGVSYSTPADLTACQPIDCGFLEPNAWLIVSVPSVSPVVHEVTPTCDSDDTCAWPGCYPQSIDFSQSSGPPCDDDDGDFVCEEIDNCPGVFNYDQLDWDGDGLGDDCDVCLGDPENDADTDGVCGDYDSCPYAANPEQEDADADGAGDSCDPCAFDADDDADADGVCGDVDVCAGTVLPEDVPTVKLLPNHYADVDGDGVFESGSSKSKCNSHDEEFTLEDTGGCSCEQIIDAWHLGKGHKKHGCSVGIMKSWIWSVNH